MIDYIKKLTIKNAGFDITDRGDCQLLSELILEKTDELISYNTLRRLFGLATYVKPSKNTLDTLSRFNGYKDYIHYLKINPYEAYWSDKEKLYHILHEDSESILHFINGMDYRSEQALDFMISLCRELVYLDKQTLLNEVFHSDFFNERHFSYSETLHFGNSVGMLFKTYSLSDDKLLLNPNFLKYVYCIYVDYSNLNGYYGDWCLYVITTTTDIQIKCFSLAVLELKKYFNGLPVSYDFFSSIVISDFHSILIGRLFSVQLLSNQYGLNDITVFFNTIKKSPPENVLDYLYEPIIVALLSRNFLLMDMILKFISNEKVKVNYYYHEHHMNLFRLLTLFNSKFESNELTTMKNKDFVLEEGYFKYSYKEIIMLLIYVYKFHTSEDTDFQLNAYKLLSKKLNYPLFSKGFINNYFN
ncbi:hypothetical protein [Flavobacterium sp.]|jgi:hypothetical protein|uniref:hypothetical protein n=1 Tax=Flavobacterium sp. TaxID=239 RepID=UPI0037BE4DE4